MTVGLMTLGMAARPFLDEYDRPSASIAEAQLFEGGNRVQWRSR